MTVFLLIFTCLYAALLGMAQMIALIDDNEIYQPTRPNGIQYSLSQSGKDDWARILPPDSDGRHKNTISVTQTVNASAVYFFKGSAIGYYSDKSPELENMVITLDGRRPTLVNTTGALAYQKLLWFESDLDAGDHQLVVSLGTGNGIGSTASLDYLEITHGGDIIPSSLGPGARDSDPSGVIVDNEDPRVVYEGAWSIERSVPPRSHYFSGSQHSTKQLGDSLTFNFTGTAIYYFAEKKPSNGRVSISIDGGAGDTVDTSLPATDDNPPRVSDRWTRLTSVDGEVTIKFSQALCWSKTGLIDGLHIVKITHMGDSGMDVSLDFFKYTPRREGSPRSTPLGAIIGGSVGGGLFLIIASAILYLLHRRRLSSMRRASEQADANVKDSENLASPSIVDTTVPYKGYQQGPTNNPMSEVSVSSAEPVSSLARNTPQSYPGLPEPYTA